MPGGQWQAVYGDLDHVPVYAKAGAIVPLSGENGWGSLENPAALDIHIFAGADNEFVLFEDDGIGGEFRIGQGVLHGKYGEGVIMQMEGAGDRAKVEVNFPGVGAKWLMVGYANLQAVD